MDEALALFRGVVTLDRPTYRAFLDSPNVMKRGFFVFLACYFLGTIPVFGESFINNSQRLTPELAAEFEDQFLAAFEQFQPPGEPDPAMEQFKNNFLVGINIGVEIDGLPTLLPRTVADFLHALGAWVNAALGGIWPWIGYGALVLLLAKWTGGKGGLNHFYGLTALAALPLLLRIFSFIPFAGPAFALAGLIWGVAVYTRAVQISQGFSPGKAIVITFAPLALLLLFFACVSTTGMLMLATALGGQ